MMIPPRCVAKNSLGETDGSIKLYRKYLIEIPSLINAICVFYYNIKPVQQHFIQFSLKNSQ